MFYPSRITPVTREAFSIRDEKEKAEEDDVFCPSLGTHRSVNIYWQAAKTVRNATGTLARLKSGEIQPRTFAKKR